MKSTPKIALVALVWLIVGGVEAIAGELSGTEWQLVKIMSMDDSVSTPTDASKYTLRLDDDRRASIMADCNKATGSWAVETPSQIQLGDIAATHASCRPGTISGKYLAQFEWVRSYVLEDNHLFLATMADGSIIEFAPAFQTEPSAIVLGEEILTKSSEEIQVTILDRLFAQYAKENQIDVEQEEIDTLVKKIKRDMAETGLTAQHNLTEDEKAQAETMQAEFARSIIRNWKINKALYAEYGGRIIYQQLGPEPLDAYRHFLEKREKDGAFRIRDKAASNLFWRYFTDDSIHDFIEPGSADEVRAFTIAPWSEE